MADIEVVEGTGDAEKLLKRFRERVFEAAHKSIDQYSVPLIVEDGKHLVEVRSGLLLQIADMHFLVTAGHHMVAHHAKGHRVGIALPVKGSQPILLIEEYFWTTRDDQEDLSVTQLTPAVNNYIKDHYRYLRLSSVMSKHDPNQGKGMYLIFGFPDAMLGVDDAGIKKMESWKYLTIPYTGESSTIENYNPDLHLVVVYERDTWNQDGQRVHPPGMSGCGIWFVGSPYTHALFREEDFKFVAIQNRWHRQHEYAKGTWIDDVLLILWKYYPETHKPLMLAGYNFFGR